MSKICILYTGGTIGMSHQILGDESSPLVPQNLEFLLSQIPVLANNQIKYANQLINFEIEQLMAVDSSEINPNHWKIIAKRISEIYHLYQGFVILHGTDTMAYTASALAFCCENLQKPIVLTGAQKPLSDIRSDGVSNIINSILVAASSAANLDLIPEVVIVFAEQIFRGCRCSKFSIEDFQAFESPNYPALGSIGSEIKINSKFTLPVRVNQLNKFPAESLKVSTNFNQQVMQFMITPGMSEDLFAEILMSPKLQGIIIRSFGSGNIPSSAKIIESLKIALNTGKVIINLTQCRQGKMAMENYAAGSFMADLGVISAGDMTAEAATCKLMWLLENYPISQVRQLMSENLRGELGL